MQCWCELNQKRLGVMAFLRQEGNPAAHQWVWRVAVSAVVLSWVLLVRLSWVLLEEILWYGFILMNVFLIVWIGTKFQQSLFILIHSAGLCQSTLQLTLGSRFDSTQTPSAVIGRYLTNSSNKVLVKRLIFNLGAFVKYFQKVRESSN